MSRHATGKSFRGWQVLTAIGLVLLFSAGTQSQQSIRKMYCENRIVTATDEKVWVTDTVHKADPYGTPVGPDWRMDAPTIQAANGRFLAFDAKGTNPALFLAENKGPGCEWAFTFVDILTPKRRNRYLEGYSGTKAKLQATEGPYKGWYVGLNPEKETDANEEHARQRQSLILVEHPRNAAVFTFLTERQWGTGK